MLRLSIIFFIIAVISAIFGFGGIADAAVDIAVFLFYFFVILFVVSLVLGLLGAKNKNITKI